MKTRFDQAAAGWDQDQQRVRMAESIADVMRESLHLNGNQVLMDYGTGTGLIALKFQPQVHRIVAVDLSQGMLDILHAKLVQQNISNIELLKASAAGNAALPAVDVIVSSMALHHVRDTAAAAKSFWEALKPGGQIAIADLDEDNGEFHGDPRAAAHPGFNRARLQATFADLGFKSLVFQNAYAVEKTVTDGQKKVFTIFLMIGKKPLERLPESR
ncbi:MAG: class I SAM-dependent methyltransferase [Candidatus Firestonebacteria bacterium]|nr:class I SAM-dependent methyltransferase [Candidatus Firestonebacteria bacterium]